MNVQVSTQVKSRMRNLVASFTMAFAIFWTSFKFCVAAEETRAIYPPLQIFKELCLDVPWSLRAIADLARQHDYALISAEDNPMPDGSPSHLINWEAKTSIGPVGITTVEGYSENHGYTSTCSVSAPTDSTDFIQSWLSSSFGNSTSTLKKSPDALEIHWTNVSEDMKIDVILLTRMPDHNSALITVIKHKDPPKSRAESK
jgi:hypothetical protein